MKKLGADYGYTMDGDKAGCVEDETFSADSVTIIINGVITHPGSAYGKMENAIKIAGEIIANLPKDTMTPETTKGLEGFIHPVAVSGGAERTQIKFIIRDFITSELKVKEDILKNITEKVLSSYKNSSYDFVIEESYRNMKEILDTVPFVTEYALEAASGRNLLLLKRVFAVVLTAEASLLWDCLHQTFSQVSMVFTASRSGFQCRICIKQLRRSFICA